MKKTLSRLGILLVLLFVLLPANKALSYASSIDRAINKRWTSTDEVIEYVRGKAVEREDNISVVVSKTVYNSLDLVNFSDIMEHTGNPKEGDYLRYSASFLSCTYQKLRNGDYQINYNFAYYDTAEDELLVDAEVSRIVDRLDLKNSTISDYTKVYSIYKYLVTTVVYDYETFEYTKAPESGVYKPASFSAAGAFVSKYAVCQGISEAFYRLCLEAGIDSRIITSDELNHAWNIVKLDGLYYYVECTWNLVSGTDLGFNGLMRHDPYFLKGKYTFSGHLNNDDQFCNADFADRYPLSDNNYSYDGKGYLLGFAPEYTLETITGEKVTTTAENGRPKALIFVEYLCEPSEALLEKINKNTLMGIDVVVIEASKVTWQTYNSEINKWLSKYTNVKSCKAIDKQLQNMHDSYLDVAEAAGLFKGLLEFPTTVCINSENQIVYYHSGDEDSVVESIKYFGINDKKTIVKDSTEDNGEHKWELVAYNYSHTEDVAGEGFYRCSDCKKLKMDMIPSLKNTICGKCGDKATWTFYPQTGILVVGGEGALWNNETIPNGIGWTTKNNPPFMYYSDTYISKNDVQLIVVGSKITKLGNIIFEGFDNLKYILFEGDCPKPNDDVMGYNAFPSKNDFKVLYYKDNSSWTKKAISTINPHGISFESVSKAEVIYIDTKRDTHYAITLNETGNNIKSLKHEYDSGVVVEKATYTNDGIIDYTCVYCNSVIKGKIDKLAIKPTSISNVSPISAGQKITWKKVSEATGYYIYRSDNGGKYKKIKTITKGSVITYSDKTAKANGTKYQYKVSAYVKDSNGVAESKQSLAKTVYSLSKPQITSAKNLSGKKMNIVWVKNSKASGYEIQYSTDKNFKSDVKKVKVKNNSTAKSTVSKLTKGKTYYIRVRAYKTVSKKNYYSDWSAVKSVKISK